MASLAAFSSLVLAGFAYASPFFSPALGPMDLFKRISSGCGTSGPASCHNLTRETDLCCFESPGVSSHLHTRFE